MASAEPTYASFSTNVFVPSQTTREDLTYFAGLLNSRLLWKWFQHNAKRRGVALEINGGVLSRAPIKRIDFADAAQRAAHDKIADLSRALYAIRLQMAQDQSEGSKRALTREFGSLDEELDKIVYELYGLSEAEKAEVEEATRTGEDDDPDHDAATATVLEFPEMPS